MNTQVVVDNAREEVLDLEFASYQDLFRLVCYDLDLDAEKVSYAIIRYRDEVMVLINTGGE